MITEKPYFMKNTDWYTVADIMKDGFPEDGRGYHLTDKAPQKAIDSYNEFYGIKTYIDEDGNEMQI